MMPLAPRGLAYLPYQTEGIRFAADRPSALVADEMGLGKTVQAVGWLNAMPMAERALVVCPASLKINWRRELDRWLISPFLDVEIINYDILHKLNLEQEWDAVIFDEAHYLKNPSAMRSRYARLIRAPRRLLLTGTPLLNRPREAWHLLHLLAPVEWPAASWHRFAMRYCGARMINIGKKRVWDFDGASNLDELRGILAPFMIRRLKAEVLADLPAKRRQIIELPVTGIGPAMRARLAEATARVERIEDTYRDDARALEANLDAAWNDLARIRHEAGLEKVAIAMPLLRDAVEASRKIVVFAHHRDVIAAITNGLADYGAVVITGDTATKARQELVDLFQMPNSGCRVLVGQIQAAGVGLTLTASSHVSFVEITWSPGDMTQAEDRCHRIGQKNAVLVQHLVLEGSLDARMARSLVRKQEIVHKALDAKEETL
jgi:SWI/SNF-related matrix-associated actin-dependent regulator of chromatin subfamily A-like protein 1